MSRLIDADALLEAIKDFPYGYRGMIESTISEQPTIEPEYEEIDFVQPHKKTSVNLQPERKKGKWIVKKLKPDDDYRYAICDQCGQIEGWDENVGMLCALMNEKYAHFCPNCGADMREGAQE